MLRPSSLRFTFRFRLTRNSPSSAFPRVFSPLYLKPYSFSTSPSTNKIPFRSTSNINSKIETPIPPPDNPNPTSPSPSVSEDEPFELIVKKTTPLTIFKDRTQGSRLTFTSDHLPWYYKIIAVAFGYYRSTARRKRAALHLYNTIVTHAERVEFYDVLGLEQNFQTWHSLLVLHLWMLLVRLRIDSFLGKRLGHEVFGIFFQDAEERMIASGISNPFLLSKTTKQYNNVYLGAVLSYDESLKEKKDSLLADALWRNVFRSRQNISPRRIETLLHYVRSQMTALDKLPSDDIFHGFLVLKTISSLQKEEKKKKETRKIVF